MIKPFCTVPFVEGFSGTDTAFRNCCAIDPAITSLPDQTFSQWWQDKRRIDFANSLYSEQWPKECHRCQLQEEWHGSSFRTSVNDNVVMTDNFGHWPSRWNLKFGNVCNLACWTCNEHSSSVIAQHKKTINILPENFQNPTKQFDTQWPELEKDVLKSYNYHKTVTITLLGGEPLYNKLVLNFLNRLIVLGLGPRTRLEFHTNGTQFDPTLFNIGVWNYVCVFLSFDAVGKKAEWLRYGSNWTKIESNIESFKEVSDYIEVHCTLSILNINDLPALDKFCKSCGLALKIMVLSSPDYMSILNWPGDKDLIVNRDNLVDNGYEYYYELIGKNPDNTAIIKLKDYINQFNSIRNSVREYDIQLANAIGL